LNLLRSRKNQMDQILVHESTLVLGEKDEKKTKRIVICGMKQ
jgi:hypothetical protein